VRLHLLHWCFESGESLHQWRSPQRKQGVGGSLCAAGSNGCRFYDSGCLWRLSAFPWWLRYGVQLDVSFGDNVVKTHLVEVLVKLLQDSRAQRFVRRQIQRGEKNESVELFFVLTLDSRGVHTDRVESNQVCASLSGFLVLFEQRASKEVYSDGEHACFARDCVEKEMAS
jgi:hypothetical protein